VQALRGQVENQSYELEQLRRQQTSAYTDLDRRLQAGQSVAGGVAPLPTLTPAAPGTVAGTPAPESSLQVETEANGALVATDPVIPPGGEAPVLPPMAGDPAAGMAPPAADAGALAPPAGPAAPAVPEAPPAATADDATSEAAYRDAFSLLRAGDYDKAIAAFTAFQTDHPASQYGDNAQYWLAEAYYAKGQYAPAISEYQKMLSQYPGSKKLSHAMLKTGYSYDKLGKAAEASATLKALVEQYPGSSAARLAEERLAQIKAGKPR
jgi:tol-pal system protein YbgF